MARELIGDYIHLHYKNYLNNGTKFSQGTKPNPSQAMSKQREAIKDMYLKNTKIPTQQELENISNLYNFMFDYNTAQKVVNGISQENWEQMRKVFENNLLYALEDKKGLQNWIVNVYKGSVRLNAQNAGKKAEGTLRSLKKVNEILKQIIQKRDVLIKIDNSVTNEIIQIENLIKKLDDIDNNFKQYVLDEKLDKVNSILQKLSNSEYTVVDENRTPYPLHGKVSSYIYVKGNLVELASVVKQKTATSSATAGMALAGEIWGELSLRALNNNVLKHVNNLTIKAAEQIDHAMEKTKKGTVAAKVVGGSYTTKSGRYNEPIITSIGDDIVGKTNINMQETEDKIDAVIDFYDGRSLAASIKNYSPHTVSEHGIGLLSGTGLLKFTQDYPNFLNHYLNITVEHNEPKDAKPNKQTLTAAHAAMTATLGAVALAGGTYSNKNGMAVRERFADLFIINRQAGQQGRGKYEVYSTSALINKLVKRTKLITAELTPSPPWPNEKYDNEALSQYSNAYARCIKLIAYLHSINIRVHAEPDLLK